MNLLSTLHTGVYAISGGVKDRVDSLLARQRALALAECRAEYLQAALSVQIAQNRQLLAALSSRRGIAAGATDQGWDPGPPEGAA